MAAPTPEKKKRKSKRKSRTEVSPSPSPSSSSSGEEDVVRPPKQSSTPPLDPQTSNPGPDNEPEILQSVSKVNPDQLFTDFYLKQATKEFANDLDKLRSAGDFHGERSVGVLIEALRQGTKCFSGEERERVVSGVGEGRGS